MKTIENRPAALVGKSDFYLASFEGETLPVEVTNFLWPINQTPNFDTKNPVAFVPSLSMSEWEEGIHRAYIDFSRQFENLPLDKYLQDDASFRYRRFGRYELSSKNSLHEPIKMKDVAYFQSEEINIYAGGIQRRFDPLGDELSSNAFLLHLIVGLFNLIPSSDRVQHARWVAGVHPTRVVGSAYEAGYGAPEGLHQDGHIFASTILVARQNVKGGDSIFADLDKVIFWQHALMNPGEAVLWRDGACWHDVSEVLPANITKNAIRDIVGISFNPLRD